MVASISSSTVSNWSDSLFSKLDTKKQGYIDQSDLTAALGTDEAGSTTNKDDAAAMLKAMDGDSDGKITKSELSTAISKVADELNAQFDSSRVDKSQLTPPGAAGVANTDEASSTENDQDKDDAAVSATGSATGSSSTASAAKAAPAAGGTVAASSTESTNKYVQAADTDTSGDVSDDEAAAYKKLMAKQAEAKAGSKPAEAADSDKDLARALDMLKQYVDNSGAAGSATSSTSTVDTSA